MTGNSNSHACGRNVCGLIDISDYVPTFILLEKRHHYVRESRLTQVAEAFTIIGSRGLADPQLRVGFAEVHTVWLVRKVFGGLAERVVGILIYHGQGWRKIFQSGQNLSICRC